MTVNIITSIIVWAITGALGALTTYLAMRYKKVLKENDALKNGMQSLLRNNIIDAHDKYTKKKYCPIYGETKDKPNLIHPLLCFVTYFQRSYLGQFTMGRKKCAMKN